MLASLYDRIATSRVTQSNSVAKAGGTGFVALSQALEKSQEGTEAGKDLLRLVGGIHSQRGGDGQTAITLTRETVDNDHEMFAFLESTIAP